MTAPAAYTPFLAPDASPAVNGTEIAACKPEVATMTVTPDIAREWAEKNTRNRPVRYNKVAQFARDMKAGRWALNGETIKIDVDGNLLDGQHRVYACIQAEVPFVSVVITGLPPEAQDTIDTGIARRMADQLSLRGETNASLLAAIARWAFKWLRGIRMQGATEQEPTHEEMLALIDADPRLRDAATWGMAARAQFKSVAPSVWGMAWLVLHGSDHLTAEVFLHRALTGEDCPAGDPALAFRNRIYRAREDGERLNQYEQLAYLIIAWNAFKDGRTLKIVKFPNAKLSPKTFPEPK